MYYGFNERDVLPCGQSSVDLESWSLTWIRCLTEPYMSSFQKHCALFTAKNTAAIRTASCSDVVLFAFWIVMFTGNGIFFVVDIFLVTSLSSHSCGTRVLRKGVGLVAMSLTLWLGLFWGEGTMNTTTWMSAAHEVRQVCYDRFGVVSPEMKLFSGVWGPSFLTYDAPSPMHAPLAYWISIAAYPLIYFIAYLGIILEWWHPPRQPILTPLCGFVSWTCFMMTAYQKPLTKALGFNPQPWGILFASIGSIMIMILDSRWWNNYSGSA